MWRLSALALVLVVMLTGCPEDNPTNPNDGVTNDKNKFTVTGNGFSNSTWKGYSDETKHMAFISAVVGKPSVTFSGLTTNANETFTCFLLFSAGAPGTYPVNSTEGNAISIQYGSPVTSMFAASGSIIVSQFDAIGGRAKGTFSGTLVSASVKTMTLSNGVFDVRVIAEP
jgi:hypothetical protein